MPTCITRRLTLNYVVGLPAGQTFAFSARPVLLSDFAVDYLDYASRYKFDSITVFVGPRVESTQPLYSSVVNTWNSQVSTCYSPQPRPSLSSWSNATAQDGATWTYLVPTALHVARYRPFYQGVSDSVVGASILRDWVSIGGDGIFVPWGDILVSVSAPVSTQQRLFDVTMQVDVIFELR